LAPDFATDEPTFRPMRERPLTQLPLPRFLEGEPRPVAVAGHPAQDATIDELAAAAIRGDVAAVGRLYDALVGPIYRYVAMRVRQREDAEDITQAVFERIVISLPRYRDRGRPFAAFAFRVAHNAVIDHVRRHRPHPPLDPEIELTDGTAGVEALSVRGEELRELQSALRRLTPDQQEAIALRYGAGLSAEEAGAAMGRSANTVRALTFRAIGALRRHMAEPRA
jgi:RNA polymerase sigma-70 factor (ECF subfamily)